MTGPERPRAVDGPGGSSPTDPHLLRPAVVAAYARNPRDERIGPVTAPDTWRARWLPVTAAAALTVVLLTAGVLVRAPVQRSAVVTAAGADRLTVVVQGEPPPAGSVVPFTVSGVPSEPRTVLVGQVGDGSATLVGDTAGVGVGSALSIDLGSRSLLAVLVRS